MSRCLKYIMVVSLAAGLFSGIAAQKTAISGSFGGATFQMDDMKYLLDNILSSYPVEGAVLSSFPPYFCWSVNIIRQFYPHLRAGVGYTYTTTGSRANYTDYSGNIETNMIAISHRLGASVNYSLLGTEKLDLSLYGQLDVNITNMDIASSIYVMGFTNGINNTYSSISPNGSAGLEFLYNFRTSAIGIQGGYLIDSPGKLKNKDTGNYLEDPNDPERILTSDWSGWRLGIKGILWLK